VSTSTGVPQPFSDLSHRLRDTVSAGRSNAAPNNGHFDLPAVSNVLEYADGDVLEKGGGMSFGSWGERSEGSSCSIINRV
jgi:hypothetical protein